MTKTEGAEPAIGRQRSTRWHENTTGPRDTMSYGTLGEFHLPGLLENIDRKADFVMMGTGDGLITERRFAYEDGMFFVAGV